MAKRRDKKQRLSDNEVAEVLGLVMRRIRDDPLRFSKGGELLDERFSVKAIRRSHAIELLGTRRTFAPGLRRPEERGAFRWDRDRGKIPSRPSERFMLALQWALDLPVTMQAEQAQAVYLLAWLTFDDKATEVTPPLCEFQQLPWRAASNWKGEPWQGRQVIAEGGRPREEDCDEARSRVPLFDQDRLIEKAQQAWAKLSASTESSRVGAASPPESAIDLPPMTPKEAAVLTLLAERESHVPITSEQLASELARREMPYTDAPGIRSRMIPKFKKLGLKTHGRRGYSFPADSLRRLRKALDPDADAMRMRGGT